MAADGEAPRRTALTTTSPVDLSGYEVTREFAVSWDGTRVPLNIIAAPGIPRDGSAPALLTAYGGYAISLVPKFSSELLLWLERGGVVVVANIRGGGEYGEEWHHAGRLATKQNCFDDFIACADHLVESGITSRDLLAIIGGSNGGLLMGAVLTQRPDLARAVVAAVPVMDSLRSETTTNGRYNTPEFGTVEDPVVFKALLDYSPYHNVLDGTELPGRAADRGRERHPGRCLARQEDDSPTPGGDDRRVGPCCCGWRPAATSRAPSTRPSTRPPTCTRSSSTSWVWATSSISLSDRAPSGRAEEGDRLGRRQLNGHFVGGERQRGAVRGRGHSALEQPDQPLVLRRQVVRAGHHRGGRLAVHARVPSVTSYAADMMLQPADTCIRGPSKLRLIVDPATRSYPVTLVET